MDDLIAFLKARLDEDEQAVRDCEGDPVWHVGEQAKCDCCARVRSGTSDLVCTPDDRYAAHIARHDPARVLREVEAKRKIIEAHESNHECSTPDDNCVWINEFDVCFTLRELAAVHADHPDYQAEEWKP